MGWSVLDVAKGFCVERRERKIPTALPSFGGFGLETFDLGFQSGGIFITFLTHG